MTKRVQTATGGAWIRDKNPKPKPPVDTTQALLPALLYFSGSSRPKAKNLALSHRKKQSQHLPMLECIQEMPPRPPPPVSQQIEYIQAPSHHSHHRGSDTESVYSYERQPSRATEPTWRDTPREPAYRPKPRAVPRISPEAARLQIAMDRMAMRSTSGSNSGYSAWASALTPLNM